MPKDYNYIGKTRKDLEEHGKKAALTAGAVFILGEAIVRAPVDKGQLRGSLSYRVDGDEALIYTNVLHAPYLEFGTGIYAESGEGRKTPWSYQNEKGEWVFTRGIRPQPYMRPAMEDNEDRIAKVMRDTFKKVIGRSARG